MQSSSRLSCLGFCSSEEAKRHSGKFRAMRDEPARDPLPSGISFARKPAENTDMKAARNPNNVESLFDG